jgi:hypothetical protein
MEMAACGKPGKTIRLFSHPSHSPWKSLRRLPHFHRHDDHGVGCKFPKTRPLRDTHSEGKVILAGRKVGTNRVLGLHTVVGYRKRPRD